MEHAGTLLREREFHDEWASGIEPADVQVLETFSAATSPEARWLFRQMGDISGKRVLDLGSGAGEAAVFFALKGGQVTATDISGGMLEVVEKVAQHHGVSVKTKIASSEDLSAFEDESFDIVYGANMLHHVDIETCLKEVKRVLRAGGMIAFSDPIAYNPAINVYRRMADHVRTQDEHPFKRRDLTRFSAHFKRVKTRFFWLTTLTVFLRFYLIDRIHPNEDRYWKRILTREPELKGLYRPLEKIDNVLLSIFPFLKWWCWTVAVVARK